MLNTRMRQVILLVAVDFLVLAACSTGSSRATSTPDPYESFTTVKNSCGACGTNSPVGGWEAANGRSLILSENGNFVAHFEDGTSMSGEWLLSGGQLCLTSTVGASSCFSYQQKVDAMRLDDAIYLRW